MFRFFFVAIKSKSRLVSPKGNSLLSSTLIFGTLIDGSAMAIDDNENKVSAMILL